MVEEKEPTYGMMRYLWHPQHKKEEAARWVGWFRHYSQYEFLSDGLITLGLPYRKI